MTKPVVYIAARWGDMPSAKALRLQLEERGVDCNSRWLDEDPGVDRTADDAYRASRAQIDVEDVRSSDALVLFNTTENARVGTGGCHVETGLAIQARKPVFIFGPRTNVFHFLPTVRVYDDLDALANDIRYVRSLLYS